MRKEDIYHFVMEMVSKVTGISREDILHKKDEECSDARSILVKVMSQYITDRQIADLIGYTMRGVNYIRTKFDERACKWLLKQNYDEVRSLCECIGKR